MSTLMTLLVLDMSSNIDTLLPTGRCNFLHWDQARDSNLWKTEFNNSSIILWAGFVSSQSRKSIALHPSQNMVLSLEKESGLSKTWLSSKSLFSCLSYSSLTCKVKWSSSKSDYDAWARTSLLCVKPGGTMEENSGYSGLSWTFSTQHWTWISG